MHCAVLLAVGGVLIALPASATTTFVDTLLDRSAWEEVVSDRLEEPFDNEIAQADVLDFDSGIQSVASGAIDMPNHLVDGDLGRFRGTLRPAASTSPGYLTFVWTFPEPVMAFGADFFSIGGSRQVSVQGTFDSGLEAFDLRTLFIADGGLDQGFFGLISDDPFTSITLIALGTSTNDAITVDNLAIGLPEPTRSGLAALLTLAGLIRRRRRVTSHTMGARHPSGRF